MVRLLPLGIAGAMELGARFQSHNGAIAASNERVGGDEE